MGSIDGLDLLTLRDRHRSAEEGEESSRPRRRGARLYRGEVRRHVRATELLGLDKSGQGHRDYQPRGYPMEARLDVARGSQEVRVDAVGGGQHTKQGQYDSGGARAD